MPKGDPWHSKCDPVAAHAAAQRGGADATRSEDHTSLCTDSTRRIGVLFNYHPWAIQFGAPLPTHGRRLRPSTPLGTPTAGMPGRVPAGAQLRSSTLSRSSWSSKSPKLVRRAPPINYHPPPSSHSTSSARCTWPAVGHTIRSYFGPASTPATAHARRAPRRQGHGSHGSWSSRRSAA